ncbi:unnamed protein product [Prunus armeniaca]|uniref:Translocon-associated protein subunit beta n=1 Tax=Prunus armeniaca TaxID=36596 RepID=A0A6J5UH72_PRUAR|nr:unnamed protein product [Prunus armeniaca]
MQVCILTFPDSTKRSKPNLTKPQRCPSRDDSPPPSEIEMAKNPISSALISAVVVLFLFTSALASSDSPFIVSHKKASLNRLKSGAERVSVSIDIYNQGSSTAYDVSLSDESWPQDIFDVVNGNTSKSWERLDAGGIISHSFELEAKEKGIFNGAPALITFRIPTKAALQESYSTPILPLDVLADRPPENKFDSVKRLLAKYGSLISVLSIVVLFVYLVASPSKSGAAKGGKKRR